MPTSSWGCFTWKRLPPTAAHIGVCLATNLNTLLQKEDDACWEEGIIEGIEVQSGSEWLWFARRMEEGTEPDEVGTAVSELGVRVFLGKLIPAKPPTDRPPTLPGFLMQLQS